MIDTRVGDTFVTTKNNGKCVFDCIPQDVNSEERLRDQLLDVLVAGRDTTTWPLAWTL